MAHWRFNTRIGEARIIRRPQFSEGQWRAELGDEDLGGYGSPEAALGDLTGGHCWSHSSGVDTSTLGLPDELSEWENVGTPGHP